MKLKDIKIGSKFRTQSDKVYVKTSDHDNLEFDWCLPCDKDYSNGGLRLISSSVYVRLKRDADVILV